MRVVYEQCYKKGCGHSPFPMAKQFQDRCRKTHETFYCPGGHAQGYYGENEEEKLRKQVKRLQTQLESAKWRADALRRQAHRCPWIECGFVAYPINDFDMRAMWSHLRSAHGMPTKSQALALLESELTKREE